MGAELGNDGRTATRGFVAALYRLAPASSLVEVRFSVPSGMRRRFHRVADLDGVADAVAGLARWTDVFVGVVPRRRRGGRRDDLAGRASVVWVDCDSVESVAALAAFWPRPAIQVASGTGRNRHAYWALRDPVGLDVVELLNRRLALELGADAPCGDAARILRPAGSANWKSGRPAPVRLIELDEQLGVEVAELDRRLPALPAEPAVPPCSSSRAAGEDRLLEVPPRVYVERLTGAPVGRDGKVRCPFHEDRTPSLHVYEDPQRGWFCFGCRRGGSIYDFASLLLGRGTRGEDFLELRRELAAIIG
jgi:CHC2-type zinc finger protein